MNSIGRMNENELRGLLNEICDVFSIGDSARSSRLILANVKHASRRSGCLSMIENYHTITVENEDGEETPEQLLSWGESPTEYIETYKDILRLTNEN